MFLFHKAYHLLYHQPSVYSRKKNQPSVIQCEMTDDASIVTFEMLLELIGVDITNSDLDFVFSFLPGRTKWTKSGISEKLGRKAQNKIWNLERKMTEISSKRFEPNRKEQNRIQQEENYSRINDSGINNPNHSVQTGSFIVSKHKDTIQRRKWWPFPARGVAASTRAPASGSLAI